MLSGSDLLFLEGIIHEVFVAHLNEAGSRHTREALGIKKVGGHLSDGGLA